MRNIRFYLEHESPSHKRKGNHLGTVFAAHVHDNGRFVLTTTYFVEGMAAVFNRPDSPVESTAADREYLRKCCKRISEAEAREIHPALFARLDS